MSKYFLPIMCLLAFCCNSKEQTAKTSILQLDKDSLFVGDIRKGDSINVSVTIRNTGEDTLRITDIGVDCGCTNASLSNKNISPSDSAFLNVTYNNSKSHDSGYFRKAIVIRNNSPEMFKILRISGSVF
jgi:hypothetical protein